MKKMFIISGCSGGGKSTLARKIRLQTAKYGSCGSIILSTDDLFSCNIENFPIYLWSSEGLYHAHTLNQIKCKVAAQKSIDNIIIDNTNLTWKEIRPYAEIGLDNVYEIVIMRPEGNFTAKELFSRNVHGVPLETIERQMVKMESIESLEMKVQMLKKEMKDCKYVTT